MAEQTFRSPGFFEREIDLSERQQEISGVPAGVIGTSAVGPAFIPVTVGSLNDFVNRFGEIDPEFFAPYAVDRFLRNRTALTFLRVLGAGANDSSTDIAATVTQGTVKNAGFRLVGSMVGPAQVEERYKGVVQFIAAQHEASAGEFSAYPQYTNNNSFPAGTRRESGGDPTGPKHELNLVRAMLMTPTGSRFCVMHHNWTWKDFEGKQTDIAIPGWRSVNDTLYKKFKLVLSSSVNSSGEHKFNDEGYAGIKIFTASLNPTDESYIGKILNTDPGRFQEAEHLLYADFAVEDEVATIKVPPIGLDRPDSTVTGSIGILSGSGATIKAGPTNTVFRNIFGRFDTRYQTPRTTMFLSQPYGKKEFGLFYFETIADGANASAKYKVSISNIRKSTDPKVKYPTFTVLIRNFGDSDTSPEILEQYSQCTLDPNSDTFIARRIGDYKVRFDFDAESVSERRFVVSGKYPNVSSRVRVIMSSDMNRVEVPEDAAPFGFEGLPVIKTNDTLTDRTTTALSIGGVNYGHVNQIGEQRLALVRSASYARGGNGQFGGALSGSIVPPVPMRFKATRGVTIASASFTTLGAAGTLELADSRYFWGINVRRVPATGSLGNAILNPNAGESVNPLVKSYTKFLGIEKLGTLVTGSGRNVFNNNKFSLANVALSVNKDNLLADDGSITGAATLVSTVHSYLTGTADEHMRETCYIRNAKTSVPEGYTVNDGLGMSYRVTLASLYSGLTSSVYFNRFTDYSKFTNIFYGGFDGVNILDRDMAAMNDKSTSKDLHGKATGELDIGLSSNGTSTGATEAFPAGTGLYNNAVASYKTAIDIMTDPFIVRTNLLAIPGIRDSFVTDHAASKTKDYSKAMYLMDIPNYDKDGLRIYQGDGKRPDVTHTKDKFDSRAVDNNYSATYFPDVTIVDDVNDTRVTVPSSIAAIAALGFNDAVSYPWFAPAGFNRAALEFVTNTATRLNKEDRDDLYDARINPIASFPNAGYVIFGQKTLQQARSALDRVNVRRMLLEVKRLVVDVSNRLLFEQNTAALRSRFVSQITPLLALVQSQQGIDKFSVICDNSNNTTEDIEGNRLNGRIVLVPTRAVEFISMDFIITNSGVSFE
jgi:hypothetical protein